MSRDYPINATVNRIFAFFSWGRRVEQISTVTRTTGRLVSSRTSRAILRFGDGKLQMFFQRLPFRLECAVFGGRVRLLLAGSSDADGGPVIGGRSVGSLDPRMGEDVGQRRSVGWIDTQTPSDEVFDFCRYWLS